MRERSLRTIPCEVIRGMFPNEVGVGFTNAAGERIEVFSDRSRVLIDQEPNEEDWISGEVVISPVKIERNASLVDLPGPGINVSTRHRIRNKDIRERSV